jgi:hypothetical protein
MGRSAYCRKDLVVISSARRNRRSFCAGTEGKWTFELRRHQPTRPSSTLRGDGSMARET